MHPSKTHLAHQALQSHRSPLDLRQRRLLILCDGRRDEAELTAMLGDDAPVLIRQLLATGHLASDEHPPAPPPRATMKRSLVATRLYMLGMLELQRNEVAALLRARLQSAHEEAPIVAALIEALDQLPRFTAAGYARRVYERVAESLPEAHLPALQQVAPRGSEAEVG